MLAGLDQLLPRSLGLRLAVVHRAHDDRHAARSRQPRDVKSTLAINGILNRAWAVPAVLALGAWLLLSPWLIGFTATAPLMWNSVICGALLLVFAGWSFAVERRRKSPDRGGADAVR